MRNNLINQDFDISSALLSGEQRLAAAGFVLRPRRHAELLLEKALGLDRTALYIRAKDDISAAALERYEHLLQRRISGEPAQHIAGWSPFYGLRLEVGPGVFIPRFDSEAVVEVFLERLKTNNAIADAEADSQSTINTPHFAALDLCCGCGAIGLAAAVEAINLHITLADSSPAALEYTCRNIQQLNLVARATVVEWDALSEPPVEWRAKFHYILANPPYIPISDLPRLHRDVSEGEPRAALTDGGDGLTFYRRWMETLPHILRKDGRLFVEIGDDAAAKVQSILAKSFNNILIHNDLSGMPRVVEGWRTN